MVGGRPMVGVAVGVTVGWVAMVGIGVLVAVGSGTGVFVRVAVGATVAGARVITVTGIVIAVGSTEVGDEVLPACAVAVWVETGQGVAVSGSVAVATGVRVGDGENAADEPADGLAVGVAVGAGCMDSIGVVGTLIAVVMATGGSVAGLVVMIPGVGVAWASVR
jgi:hypothetical protein